MTATPNPAALEACEICRGESQVKVGWHPVNNIKIKAEYDPCPNCTPGPHSFHAKQVADRIRAIYARDRALAAPVTPANEGGV